METYVILAVLAMIVFFAVRSSVKHFKGQGGCCGGGDYTPRKKKLHQVTGKKTFVVAGMHCENCASRVMEAVNDIPHVSAQAKWKTGQVIVSYEQEVPDEVICSCIERAGYRVQK